MPHILIVEDDDIVSELLAAKLKAAGHKVTLVEDGGDAVARIRAALPDLVLLDCALPTLSGADVIRTLRSELPGADMPIVLMSSRSNDAYIQSMLMEGAASFLVKPLNIRRVMETIDHQMALRDERRAVAA